MYVVPCTDAGGSDKQAKKLAKEMRLEMKRAKTDLEQDDDRCESTFFLDMRELIQFHTLDQSMLTLI